MGEKNGSSIEQAAEKGSPSAGPGELVLLRTILQNMPEGVLAVDPKEVILAMNDGAFDLLGPAAMQHKVEDAVGLQLPEVISSAALHRVMREALTEQVPLESTVVIDLTGSERFLQVYASPLRTAAGGLMGVLLVLDDITRLRKLETMRRDFVANVSHELKTPITSIKGFVETLMDGAVDNPEDARRFLNIVSRQADRLNAIFEDLLSLSRVEQEREQGGIGFEEHSIRDVIDEALQACQFQAEERGVLLDRECLEELVAPMNSTLLEQAVVNLVDNAIKHSEAGSPVRVTANRLSDRVVIQVIDRGKGIDKIHQPRIFERFYRVDRARSRREGGTGLGLAIVKHIAQAHGGYASVESEPGVGSTFSIHLPLDAGQEIEAPQTRD